LRKLQPPKPQQPTGAKADQPERASQLGTWPVQLALLPTQGEIWQGADVLIAADCVSTVMPDFHEKLLAGKTLAIGCPKLDDILGYASKLEEVFTQNPILSVTVAHMEVPCCNGMVMAVSQAISRSGKNDIEFKDITVGLDGAFKGERNVS
jgi:hypothetical protein